MKEQLFKIANEMEKEAYPKDKLLEFASRVERLATQLGVKFKGPRPIEIAFEILKHLKKKEKVVDNLYKTLYISKQGMSSKTESTFKNKFLGLVKRILLPEIKKIKEQYNNVDPKIFKPLLELKIETDWLSPFNRSK